MVRPLLRLTNYEFLSAVASPLLRLTNYDFFFFFTSGVSADTEGILRKCTANNIFTTAKRSMNGQELSYLSMKFINNVIVLAELSLRPGTPTVQVRVRV